MQYRTSSFWDFQKPDEFRETALEFRRLRDHLNSLDNGSQPWANVVALASTITALTAAGNIAMGGFKLTGLGAGSANGDSLRYEQLIGLYLLLTGGTMSGAIAMGSNKITGLAAATANGDALRYEQRHYTQVPVQSTTKTDFSTTSSTFQTTNLTASITPTSTSHSIKITAHGILRFSVAGNRAIASLFRDSTNLGDSAEGMISCSDSVGTARPVMPASMSYIDAPNTTSSITYSVKLKSNDNTTSVTWGNSGTETLILEEVI